MMRPANTGLAVYLCRTTNGLCLLYKRLERERFAWSTRRPGEHAITLTVEE